MEIIFGLTVGRWFFFGEYQRRSPNIRVSFSSLSIDLVFFGSRLSFLRCLFIDNVMGFVVSDIIPGSSN